ncbi:MAG: hypothetical protein FJ095_06135 [Deltaproteobacteria bacterium]|nr:hypothetical protein [Deltaproteobacteria bacterium]
MSLLGRLSATLATVLVVNAAPPSAYAALPEAYGLGSRAAAMAGAVGADASDFSAVAYNPAGVVAAKGVSLSVGYTANLQELVSNGRDNDVDDVRGIVAGLVVPGTLARVPFAFGVAVHVPDGGLSFLKARRQEAPRWELYDTRQQLLFLAATLALRPVPWLEVGGGVGFLSATRGAFGIRGRAELTAPFDSQLEHEVDADLTAVRYPLVGARVRDGRWGSVGVSYRGASKLDLALGARLAGTVSLAGLDVPLLYELEARTFSAFTPQTVVASFSFQRVPSLHLNLDLAWVNWSAYESPVARIQASLDVTPPPGTPVTVPASPAPTVPLAPAFRDRIVPRVGAEWRLGVGERRVAVHGEVRPAFEVPLRAGYAYEATPVPEQRRVTTFLDADRHTVSLGAGLAAHRPFAVLAGSLTLDLHASLGILPERRTVKESPADFRGDVAMRGTIVGLGLTSGVVF